jgi:hypothetical protein
VLTKKIEEASAKAVGEEGGHGTEVLHTLLPLASLSPSFPCYLSTFQLPVHFVLALPPSIVRSSLLFRCLF